mmetsp:Transcript_21097/g.38158  ORF Transcript_21097/g.38158 Transcript_21097/m.38158 type:complete len:637 (+) Transcript_21097:136-2046(+)|eukprot:CAMPEP_0201868810 /NCGR_PEP_ID=MMETSP0902-20130614/2558_1 /ASSEMBLY_ACC=CAM_ASM_000551 /TAXON_ID=420261 /ORGANISM="Thalassiosira antarctica, Strain CCMP982" /LENGTH=636 /DNA_ID=CAMNT_0048394207 /DNA_START=46 /DNA_END=1953 /DNA_ORIENTATION=-
MPLHIASRSLTLITAVYVKGRSNAFITPCPQSNVNILGSSRNDGEGDPLFFDDFGDFDGSSSSNSNRNLSSLQSRMGQVKGAEAAYDAKLARNWRRGNWSVRGFALDKSSYTTSPSPTSATRDATDEPVHVSVVAAPTSSSFTDISLPQDKALPSDRTVAVGRTDGSVFIVKMGEQYLTNFVSVTKLVVEQDENEGQLKEDNEAGMAVRVENEWMDSDGLKNRLHDEQNEIRESSMGAEGDDQMTQKKAPFEISYQFLASERGEPINSLVFDDVIQGNDSRGIICTAAGDSGEICMWTLPSSDEQNDEIMQATLLGGVHSDRIVSLETMVLPSKNEDTKEQNVLFSASRDGLFALWDLDRNGELIFSYQCTDVENDSTVSLTCADISNPTSWDDGYNYSSENNNDAILLGTSNGYVIGYLVQELISLAAKSDSDVESECPVPNLRFRAHGTDSGKGDAITAIKCGGDGTIPTSARLRGADDSQASSASNSRSISSSILLTGGEDGSVKQWEILSQKSSSSPSSIRMEHWPRLSTQRMKRRSHLFTPRHEGPVSSIAQQSKHDSSKFITCSQDGSVCVWSASSGKELFRMDGFSSSLSSLACLGRELLVTDGMEGYVCVHDFGIEEDAASNGYDLDW